jgi:CRISPR-associated endonuclease Csn1
MPNTLGLDLGSNSIGWALVDAESAAVLAAGVRIFPEGVDRDKQGGELSKNETRRQARGMRRQIVRRAKRKRRLRTLLVKAGLLPDVALLPSENPQRVEWEKNAFLASDPYTLRRKALDGPLEPYEIGRALLHIAQHRGFLSNRKTDKVKKKETSDMLQQISQLESEIQLANDRTLGEHLAKKAELNPLARVRGRHTTDKCT